MLWSNVEKRINAATRLLEHTELAGLGNTAKSSYYRSAIILLCTVVEGMVYELVRKHTSPPSHTFYDSVKYKEKHKLPATDIGSSEDLFICTKIQENVSINDKGADFGKFNIYLKNHKIITQREYSALNWARNERNKVHLQSLNTPDTGYTKAKINKIGKIISFLESRIT